MGKYRTCRGLAQFWWERYRKLPRWRFLARRKAWIAANHWAQEAIKALAEEKNTL